MVLKVEVFSDVVCPWCYIGASRLEKTLAGLGKEASIQYHPFELDPTTPESGLNIADMLRKKYGADPTKMFAHVEAQAKDAGITIDFSKQTRVYSTLRAHTLIRHAASKGTQVSLVKALFRAYFTEGQPIADPDTLASIAQPHGFSTEEALRLIGSAEERAETRSQAQAASRGGIRGVPFFVFNEELAVSGAQPEAVFRKVISQLS